MDENNALDVASAVVVDETELAVEVIGAKRASIEAIRAWSSAGIVTLSCIGRNART
ncbi:MAG TPA: hypothetical protein PLP95_05470 [Microthrixaceae bacterium]|nr:hypothetical protein [Microthrixaceae bacterium]